MLLVTPWCEKIYCQLLLHNHFSFIKKLIQIFFLFFYLQYYHPQRAHRRQQNLRIFVGNRMMVVNLLPCHHWHRIQQIHRLHRQYSNNNYNKPQEDWLALIFHCLRLVLKFTGSFNLKKWNVVENETEGVLSSIYSINLIKCSQFK